MSQHKIAFQKNTILMALLGCSALTLPMNVDAATSAKTSWAVSRVASSSLGSYCTMAQKYADDTVLTFAQNTKGEYSLALDFDKKAFTEGTKQSIAVSVDGAKPKSYDVMPQNEKTAVIGIGKDADLIQKIASSGKLSVKIGSEVSEFELTEFQAGQKELGSCMDALNAPKEPPVEKPAEKPVAVAAKKDTKNMNDVSTSSGNNEPSVEGLLAAAPKASSEMVASAPQEEFIPVVPAKPKAGEKVEKSSASQSEMVALREENAKLSRAIADQRKTFETKQASVDGAAVSELREKLEATKNENLSLKEQLDKASAKSSASAKEGANIVQLNDSVKALQQENQTLKNQIQIYASSKDKNDGTADALAKAQSENAELKQVIAGLKASPKEVAVDTSADAEVNKLRADNRKIMNELDLEKAENADLQKRTSGLQKDLEGKQLKMAGGSWDLEQATRRYQESQREIVRLGAILQSQDVKCANEKKDIEYMLFDPAIATKAQISMLNSMEDQIKEKDERLKVAGADPQKDAKISGLENELSQVKAELSDKAQQLADAQSKMQTTQTAQADVEGKNKAMLGMQADLAQKTQELATAQAKLNQLNQTQVGAATQKDADLQAIKTQLAQVQGQLQAEQLKAQQVNVQGQAQQSAEQASLVANLQLQVQQANEKIVQLQNQVATANAASLRSAAVAPAVAAPATAAYVPPIPPAGGITNASYSAPVAAQPSAVHFKSLDEFSALLKNAGVDVRGNLQQVKGGDPSSYRAYSWKTDSLYGSVEMKKVTDESQFDSAVSQYLSRAKSRCTGEFAAVPSPVKAASMAKSSAYEIACVSPSSSSSASVLFTYGNQIATTVAHEGRAEAMDLAIDARDRVSSKIN